MSRKSSKSGATPTTLMGNKHLAGSRPSTVGNTDTTQRRRSIIKTKGNEAAKQVLVDVAGVGPQKLSTKSITLITCSIVSVLFVGILLMMLMRSQFMKKHITVEQECFRVATELVKQLNSRNSALEVKRDYGSLEIVTMEAKMNAALSKINTNRNGTLFANLPIKTLSLIIAFSTTTGSDNKKVQGKIECVFTDYEILAAFAINKKARLVDSTIVSIVTTGNVKIDKVTGIPGGADEEKKFIHTLGKNGVNDVSKTVWDQMYRLFANFFTTTQPDDVIFSYCFEKK